MTNNAQPLIAAVNLLLDCLGLNVKHDGLGHTFLYKEVRTPQSAVDSDFEIAAADFRFEDRALRTTEYGGCQLDRIGLYLAVSQDTKRFNDRHYPFSSIVISVSF